MPAEEPRGAPAVHFVTLGCPKNEVDTDGMKAAVLSSAYGVTDDIEDADVTVVSTCAFIADATVESVEVIAGIADGWKAARPGRLLIVAGCMPSRYGADLETELPEVDAFLPVAEEGRLLRLIEDMTGRCAEARAGEPRTVGAPWAYLQVSDGCHRGCSYCAIPAIRGPYRSRPASELEREARLLFDGGAQELTLVGQDTSAWGLDLPGRPSLASLVRRLAALAEGRWLRLMYLQPDGVTDELVAAIAEEPSVCAYLDVPLQHASRRILRAMRRQGSAEESLALISRLRCAIPDVTLRTTVICGFPGETEADLAHLEAFLAEARFDYVGVFPYSPEEGTQAAELPGLPPEEERVERANRVREAASLIGMERVGRVIGRTVDVLADKPEVDEVAVGRWQGQAPEVDGVVLLDRRVAPGTLVRARVTGSHGFDLSAEVQ